MKGNGVGASQDLVQLLMQVVHANKGNGFSRSDSQSIASEEPLPLHDIDRGVPPVKTEEVQQQQQALEDKERDSQEVVEVHQEQKIEVAKASMKQEVSKAAEKKQTVAETLAQLKKAYSESNASRKQDLEKKGDGDGHPTESGASGPAKPVPPKSQKRKLEDEKKDGKEAEKTHVQPEKKRKNDPGKEKSDKKKVIPKKKEKEKKPKRDLIMTKKCVTSRAYHKIMDAC